MNVQRRFLVVFLSIATIMCAAGFAGAITYSPTGDAQLTEPPEPPALGMTSVVLDEVVQNADQPAPSPQPPTETETAFSLSDVVIPDQGDAIDCGDCAAQQKLKKAVAGAYKGLFFDNNFDYLCDPCYCDQHLGERMKRICVGDHSVIDFGGQYRFRYHDEMNMRGTSLNARDDDFSLHRFRYYANLEVSPRLRVYAEALSAFSQDENFASRPIEETSVNLQNGFVDYMLFDDCRGELWGRVGRQELLFGAQRSVSPLDWANTRRTFEGGSIFWRGKNWDVDAFWTNPVSPAGNDFLSTVDSQEFMGVWSTNKACKNRTIDLYFLRFLEADSGGFNFNTFGARYYRTRGKWLTEGWVAGQYGDVGASEQSGWAYTLGIGRKIQPLCWDTTVWAYYDFATGDAGGNGYHHQFPLAHKYMGFMDLFGRRNIEDVNFLAIAKPTDRVKLLAWWHIFHQQNADDGVYNVVMNQTATANVNGDTELGQELDLLCQYTLTPRSNIIFGYSHFFTGAFYATHQDNLFSGDADFFWTQFTQNF